MFRLRRRVDWSAAGALLGWSAWSIRDQMLVVGLAALSAVTVTTNWSAGSGPLWGFAFFALAIAAATFWRASPLASTLGIALASIMWRLLGLPGAFGVLLLAPLAGAFVLSRSSGRSALAVGLIALAAAESGNVIALIDGSGSVVDFVTNVAFAAAVVAVAAHWRNHRADARPPPWVASLSKREAEVYALLQKGASRASIAEELHIRPSTVKTHVRAILRKAEAFARDDTTTTGAERILPCE